MKKKRFFYGVLAFVIPVLIMMFLYWRWKIYPGSNRTIISGDGITQFANFYESFHDVLRGKASGLYSWNAGMGLNYYVFSSYYLGGFLTPILFFFSKAAIPTAYYLLTLLKIGLASLAFWFYAKDTFKIKESMNVALAVAYSLMSFVIAHSEVIIWLDAFIYFPLIILGIDRLLEKRKPKLLFISYLLLFLTSYYFAFMIGVFSFLYFIVRYCINIKQYKVRLVPYFTTSLLAGLASMVMILPTLLDLRSNGQPLTPINHLMVKESYFWDLIVKNFVGAYDTTKYDTVPFIYVGLIPLVFMIFYFVTSKIKLKDKIGYGLFGLFIISSFYIWPLALFWQGFHAPVMFHFRFSFVFSFFVIMLAGKGLEQVDRQQLKLVIHIIVFLILLFMLSMIVKPDSKYLWVNTRNIALTVLFLGLYVVYFYVVENRQFKSLRWLPMLLATMMIGEAFVNAHIVLNSMHQEWPYVTKNKYNYRSKDIQKLVNKANKNNGDDFYRFESLYGDGRVNNDGFRYGYSGIHMFSSVRNINVSKVLNGLGFRNAQIDGLTVDYMNNTLLMDSLMGVRYNLTKENPQKYGYTKFGESGEMQVYENKNALPMGIVAKGEITNFEMNYNNPLLGQKNLLKGLTGKEYNLYKEITPKLVSIEGIPVTDLHDNYIKVPTNHNNDPRYLEYEVDIPAGYQAYVELMPDKDVYRVQFSTWATVVSPKYDTGHKQIRSLGAYYNLGSYEEGQKIKFTVKIDGRNNLVLKKPKVILMNLANYQAAMDQLQKQGIEFHAKKNYATAKTNFKESTNVFTTIPYDKGWNLTIDGKKAPIKTVNGGFIQFKVPKGKHNIKFIYYPPGLKIGLILLISCTLLFVGFDIWYERRNKA